MRIEPLPQWFDEAQFGVVLTVVCALWTGAFSVAAIPPTRRRLLRLAALGPICYLMWRAYIAARQWLDITSVTGVLILVGATLLIGVCVGYLLSDRNPSSSATSQDQE